MLKKETVYDILNDVRFYDLKHTKGLISARLKDALYNLPKLITNCLNPPLPAIEDIKDSFEEISDNDLQGQGIEKIIILSNIIDIYTRFEILLGPKFSVHTNTLTEVSNLIDEVYKKGGLQCEQQYRNALSKYHTQQMELPSKILEQKTFNAKPKIEEHLLIVMDK